MAHSGSRLWHEMAAHLPYSVFATAAGIILAGIMLYMAMMASGVSRHEAHEEPAAPAAAEEHVDEYTHDRGHAAESGAGRWIPMSWTARCGSEHGVLGALIQWMERDPDPDRARGEHVAP